MYCMLSSPFWAINFCWHFLNSPDNYCLLNFFPLFIPPLDTIINYYFVFLDQNNGGM